MAERSVDERSTAIEIESRLESLEARLESMLDAKLEAVLESKLELKLESKLDAKLKPVRIDLSLVKHAVGVILTRLS